jgi:hypothetical protein
MTIATTITRNEHTGNGSTTVFAYNFKIFASGDLKVYLVTTATGASVLQTITTHYTVSGAGDAGGGNVTMVTEPASTETLVIERHTPETQATDYVENDAFGADTHETALDRSVALVQQHSREIGRSMRHIVGTPDSVSVELPFPVGDEYIKWNAGATALEGSAGATEGVSVSTYMATIVAATNEAALHAAVNLEIGTDVQAYDEDLDDISALSHTAGYPIVSDGTDWTAGGFQQRMVKGSDLASASPLVLGTDGNMFDVTGTTGFTSITATVGTLFILQFDGALTLTHSANLIMPNAANQTTQTGDRLLGFVEAANTTRVIAYAHATVAAERVALGLGTGDSPQFTGIELGHASDTTIARASAGEISVEGAQLAKESTATALAIALG